MSCIAVNLHEVKKEVKLVGPLRGENGSKQDAKFINADTGQPLTELRLRSGLWKTTILKIGTDIDGLTINNGFVPQKDWIFIGGNVVTESTSTYFSEATEYCVKDGLLYQPSYFYGLKPTTVVQHYEETFQYYHS